MSLIQEQQHKYPELNALSADQLQQLLLQHMLKVKERNEKSPNVLGMGGAHSGGEANQALHSASKGQQPFQNKHIAEMINYSSPT